MALTIKRIKNAILYKIGLRFPYSKVRVKALRALGHHVGENVYIPQDLTITQTFVHNRGQLFIGDRVSIAPKCILITHSNPNYSHIRGITKSKPRFIKIENDAWIGAGSIILPGITIHEGAVVGAGSIVTKDVPAFAVVAGNPAKILYYLTSVDENNMK